MELIFQGIETEKIHWNSNLIQKETWIRKMKQNPIFYYKKSNIIEYEWLLFDLLSKVLNCKIKIYPRFPNRTTQEKVFQPETIAESKLEFHVLVANKLGKRNYFYSITYLWWLSRDGVIERLKAASVQWNDECNTTYISNKIKSYISVQSSHF